MQSWRSYILLLTTISFTCPCGQAASQSQYQNNNAVRVAEVVLRSHAIKAPLPAYPQVSLKRASKGVAVAEVTVDRNGKVVSVVALQAPDTNINSSVCEALKMWEFRPFYTETPHEPVTTIGKITLYFDIVNGIGQIQSPTFPSSQKKK